MKNHTIYKSLQEYFKNTPKEKVLEDWNEFQHLDNEGITVKEFLENQKQTDEKGRPLTYWGGLEEHKQVTLEDYVLDSDEHNDLKSDDGTYLNFHRQSELLLKGAKLGSEWQQEQNKNLYSEEELKNAFRIGFNIGYGSPVQELDLKNEHCEKWFNQFKKNNL